MEEFSSADDAVVKAYKDIIANGHDKGSFLELNNYSFILNHEGLNKNIVSAVDVNYDYLCNEMFWYMTASEDLASLNKIKSTGSNRSSETEFSNSAYGHIIFKRHGYNQLEQVIECLSKDKNSRRAVINFNVPDRHRIDIKDEICTYALQFYINDDKLNCTCMMRSNDSYGCLPYDLAFFTELQKYVAFSLGISCGTYTHFAVSFHLYKRDLEKVAKIKPHRDIEFSLVNLVSQLPNLIPIAKYDYFYKDIVNIFKKFGVLCLN